MKSQSTNTGKINFCAKTVLFLFTAVCVLGCSRQKVNAASEVVPQKTFASAAQAGQALQMASRADDDHALAQILGPKSKAILSSGDTAEDKAALDSFAAKYDRMNRWVTMTDGNQVLYIGADNYPFPIPLTQNSSSKWYFNTAAGEEEVLARRIGRNELLAIDATFAIANAQELYFRSTHDANPNEYSLRIISTPGKQDGLYWNASEDDGTSPLSRIDKSAGHAAAAGTSNEPVIIDGYSFRVLAGQGDAAIGGSKSYVVNGKMTGGFAILASPVKYRDSGIMTFILSREGVVYQKDLGKDTANVAEAIQSYNPDEGWTVAE
jgi:hypothetical protein